MNVTGSTLAGGTLCGAHVPLPPTTIYGAATPRPRGLDWAAHTAPIDHAAIAQSIALGAATVTVEKVDGKRVKVVRKVRMKPGPKPGITYRPRFDVPSAIKLYEAGLSLAECGREVGASPAAVRVRLIQAGVRIRAKCEVRIDVADILRLHAAGGTTGSIARTLGCGETSVRTHLRDRGLKPNQADRAGVHNPRYRADVDNVELAALYAKGATVPALARHFDVDRKMVYKRLREVGAPLRDDRSALVEEMRAAGVTSAMVRSWARSMGRNCPKAGPAPRAVFEAYLSEREAS